MLKLVLRLILKDKGGKQHCLPFVLGFKKILCKACVLFNCFLVIKRILKALFSFIL